MAIGLTFVSVGVSMVAMGCFGGSWVSLVGRFGDFILALNIIK